MLQQRGAAIVGAADLSEVPTPARHGLPRAVSIAVALDPRIISDIADGPTEAYCREYDRANAQLDELAGSWPAL